MKAVDYIRQYGFEHATFTMRYTPEMAEDECEEMDELNRLIESYSTLVKIGRKDAYLIAEEHSHIPKNQRSGYLIKIYQAIADVESCK